MRHVYDCLAERYFYIYLVHWSCTVTLLGNTSKKKNKIFAILEALV